MKKFILFIFLAFILLFGFYIISTQNYLSNYINNVTTTKPMVTSKIPVIDKTINEDIDNYIIDIKYPHFNILELDTNISTEINRQIDEFKEIVKVPSPNSAKTTLMINYKIVHNQEDLLSVKFETEAYTGGAHPSHTIWTKNFTISEKKEVLFDDVILNETMLNTLSQYSLDHFQNKELEYDLFLEGFEPKKENFSTFALTDSSMIVYFNEYQIAPYVAGNFELAVPYNLLDPSINTN